MHRYVYLSDATRIGGEKKLLKMNEREHNKVKKWLISTLDIQDRDAHTAISRAFKRTNNKEHDPKIYLHCASHCKINEFVSLIVQDQTNFNEQQTRLFCSILYSIIRMQVYMSYVCTG